jgi:hypothetical protein
MQSCNSLNKYNIFDSDSTVWHLAVVILFIIFISPYRCLSQDKIEYEEISVTLIVQGIGSTEIPALIHDRDVYLPINVLFDFLKIKNSVSPGIDSVSGFFINTNATFLIDRVSRRIIYQDKVFNLKSDELIRTETDLYLKLPYYGDVFGLMCTFNFRSLSVVLNTKLELPIIREMRIEQMRKNIRRLTGETKADTTIGRNYPLFHFGMADWSLYSTQQLQSKITDTKLYIALGGTVAGGETNIAANYSINQPFTNKELSFLWRVADNDNNLLRQAAVGNINTQATSSIFSPVIGAQFTNTPTTFRRSFGYYILSDYTEPEWIVELYVNKVLVDYVKADDSGFFTFNVPLVFGNTEVTLRFYGRWGEERSTVQNISIPYNFLPAEEFEYTLSTGLVEDNQHSLFSRANINYGVNRYVTIGGGMEYLSSLSSARVMPFFKTSLSLSSGILFSGEYVYGVKSSGILSYHLPSDLQFELNYTLYDKEQKAISTSDLEERKVVISMPFHYGDFSMYSRLNIDQTVLLNMKNTFADLLLSGSAFGVSANITTHASFFDSSDPDIYSIFACSFRLPERFIIRPETQFNYKLNKFSLIKCELEKQLFGSLIVNMGCEKDFSVNSYNVQIGLRYELPFAQTGSSVNISNNSTSLSQSASGSFMYDENTNYIAANNRTSVGKCGIVIEPFLDINGNGKRDANEPRVSGLSVHVEGGRMVTSENDTTIRIYDLEPYRNYFIDLAQTSLNNISWKIMKPTISVAVNANEFKMIEIPVEVMGEVSGMVYLNGDNGKRGQGRVYVCFYKSDATLAGRVLSESDGFFSFLGLKPGSYTVRIDPTQLKTLQMTALPNEKSITIKPSIDGDVVDGLEFTLQHSK